MLRTRQLADLLARKAAALLGITVGSADPISKVLDELRKGGITRQILDIFQSIQHFAFDEDLDDQQSDLAESQAEALHHLRMVRILAEWCIRLTNEDPHFKAPPFISPPHPVTVAEELQRQLGQLSSSLSRGGVPTILRKPMNKELHKKILVYRASLANEKLQSEIDRYRVEIGAFGLNRATVGAAAQDNAIQMNSAAENLSLGKEDIQYLIEEQLRSSGWEAGKEISYTKGCRPQPGRSQAIANWPTDFGPADYALFVGNRCLAIVAAKPEYEDLSGAIVEAEKLSCGFIFARGARIVCRGKSASRVPVVLASNGRCYLPGYESKGGVWFADVRQSSGSKRILLNWPSPAGLNRLIELDHDRASMFLRANPTAFAELLRTYQRNALEALEVALEQKRERLMLAMAPSTGKTHVALSLICRLLSAKRILKACYVTSNQLLKEQVASDFRTIELEPGRTLANSFATEEEPIGNFHNRSSVHLCTIDELMSSIESSDDSLKVAPVDKYDLIVLDECHHSDTTDYLLRYARVLEHFDAVKLCMTATPVRHTVDFFDSPVFTYSYRRGVLDGYLVDHEPPTQLKAQLDETALESRYDEKRKTVSFAPYRKRQSFVDDLIDLKARSDIPDSTILSAEFNRSISQQLVKHLDPRLPEKTLIYANDAEHATMVVSQLERAFSQSGRNLAPGAIQSITMKSSNLPELIAAFQNETLPKIVVTDNILSSGVRLPKVANTVFVRRVNSLTQYHQMLGRASLAVNRRDHVEKNAMRLFDAVDLYKQMSPFSSIKPVKLASSVTMTQLFEQIQRLSEQPQRYRVYEQIIAQLRACIRNIGPDVIEQYFDAAGELPEETLDRFLSMTSIELATWLSDKPRLGPILDGSLDPDYPQSTAVSEVSQQVRPRSGKLWVILQSLLGRVS
jgi:type I restriction enzyme R subunit